MRQELEDRAEQYMQSVFDQREDASTHAKTLAAIRRLAHRHVINARRADKMSRVWKDASDIAHAHGMRHPDLFGPTDDPDMDAPAPDWPVINTQMARAKKAADIGNVCRWASRLAHADYYGAQLESPDPDGIVAAWSEITGSESWAHEQQGDAS